MSVSWANVLVRNKTGTVVHAVSGSVKIKSKGNLKLRRPGVASCLCSVAALSGQPVCAKQATRRSLEFLELLENLQEDVIARKKGL